MAGSRDYIRMADPRWNYQFRRWRERPERLKRETLRCRGLTDEEVAERYGVVSLELEAARAEERDPYPLLPSAVNCFS